MKGTRSCSLLSRPRRPWWVLGSSWVLLQLAECLLDEGGWAPQRTEEQRLEEVLRGESEEAE